MPLLAPVTQVLVCLLLSIHLSQSPEQNTVPTSEVKRTHLGQNALCCFTSHSVTPAYPREARLGRIEGVVNLILVIAPDGSIADLQVVSGDPLLLDSTTKAVRQWRFTIGGFLGKPAEIEVPLSFTYKIEDPPKPAYLHLTSGKIIRADEVREFVDGIEYAVGRRTHHISASSVANIDGCARVTAILQKAGDCIPACGPSFFVGAIPLLPSQTAPTAQAAQPQRMQVAEDVQKTKLVHVVSPLYPPLLGKRMDGTVVLHVIIAKDGSVKSARPVSGLPNLQDSSVKAVLQWQYKPTLVNGVAVEMDSVVSVVFSPLTKQETPMENK